VPDAEPDIGAEETVSCETSSETSIGSPLQDSHPETSQGTPPSESFYPADEDSEASFVTVTVEYVFPKEGMESLIYYAVPTVTLPKNEEAENKINFGNTLTKLLSDTKSEAEFVISIITDPEAPYSGYCYATGAVSYVKSSQGALTIGYSTGMYSGGVHPFHRTEYYNFSLDTGDVMKLSDVLYNGNEDAEVMLKKAVFDKLSSFNSVIHMSADQLFDELINGDFYNKWYLTENSLVLAFSQYDIADYASGAITLEIPFESIPGVIDEKYIPVSDTNGKAQISEALQSAPSLIANGGISHLTVRSSVYEWDSQLIVYYISRLENGERVNLGSYQNYWIQYNANDSFEYVPYENVPGNQPYTVLYSARGLPNDPEPISKISLSYENGSYTGENLAYTDNAGIRITDDGVEFSFSFYQDALDYIGDMHSFIRSLVTLDYEGNRYDVIDQANSIIKVTINGKSAKLTEICLGKGNGHEDFYFHAVSTEGENPFTEGLNEFTFEISMEE